MQISDEIIKVLEYLCTKIGLTIDWTSSNVLPYVEQLCGKFVKWEIGTNGRRQSTLIRSAEILSHLS